MLTGLALSIILQGCATTGGKPATSSSTVVAVKVEDLPPADLLHCPDPPAGFPAGAAAVMPADVRAALIRLASGYGQLSDQLVRLIEYVAPGSCSPPPVEPARQGSPR